MYLIDFLEKLIKEKIKRKIKLEDEEDDENYVPQQKMIVKQCPYLDTINRHVLDFDFEKLCSISLSRINVYACLVCGKYFQGRGSNTHAYTHSVAEYHHVFLNLSSLRFYCLPDNYEIVIDTSLDVSKRLKLIVDFHYNCFFRILSLSSIQHLSKKTLKSSMIRPKLRHQGHSMALYIFLELWV